MIEPNRGEAEMSRTIRYGMGVAVAGVFALAIYTMSGDSTAKSLSGAHATPAIDTFALTVAAKNLPSQQFDAH
jgi:hypothetical protein